MSARIGYICTEKPSCLRTLLGLENGELCFVLCTGRDTAALTPAAEAGIPVGVLPRESGTPAAWELRAQGILELDGVDAVVADGVALSQRFFRKWEGRIAALEGDESPEEMLRRINEILC